MNTFGSLDIVILFIVGNTLNGNPTASGLHALSSDLKTSKNRTMAPSKIQVPDDVIRITSPGSRRITFTTKKATERIRLEREERKIKLEIRALCKAEARSGSHKELEKSKGVVTVGDFLLRKLAAQENTLKELSGEATNSKETGNHRGREANLERMKHETVEALRTLSI